MFLFVPFFIYAADGAVDEVLQNETVEITEQDLEEEEEVSIDENTKMIYGKYFDLRLERKTQSALNKKIQYILTVKPHLNSAKTQIIWKSPTTIEIDPKHTEFNNLSEGEEYTFKANLLPLKGGTYEFAVSVISWQHDTNYTNSIGEKITFNENLILQPVSSEYTLGSIVMVVGILLGSAVIIVIAVMIVKSYMKKAKKWLTPPY